MNRIYKNVVFTDHALDRIKLRNITQEMVFQSIRKPDDREKEADGDTKFTRTLKARKVQVIAYYLPDEGKWLVKSAWVRGEEDPIPFWKWIITWPWRLLRGGNKRRRR